MLQVLLQSRNAQVLSMAQTINEIIEEGLRGIRGANHDIVLS